MVTMSLGIAGGLQTLSNTATQERPIPMPSKNEAARLRRVVSHLDSVMDALHRASGELYPPNLKVYREDIQELIENAKETLAAIKKDLPAKKPGPQAKSQQLDFEDEAA